jgi:hypothetical protein
MALRCIKAGRAGDNTKTAENAFALGRLFAL